MSQDNDSDNKKKKEEETEETHPGRRHTDEDTTVVFTDIHKALNTAEDEVADKPAALLAVGGELNGTIFDLFDGEITVGRGVDNTIPLEFEGVSRRHLKFIVEGDKVILEDLKSRNGTYLNNRKLDGDTELMKSDIIKIGTIALKYIPKADPERLAYDKLNLEANVDALTQAFNKAYFTNALNLEVKKSKLTGNPLSLVMFDLDFFKRLNDNYGHDAGDYVLKEISLIIRSGGIREQDIFARYGGEEFVILLPHTNLKQAFEIAERIRKLMDDKDFVYEGELLPVTASVGVADYRKGVETGIDLFKRADKALYQSKDGGRNQVNFFKA